jgi:hypothetical protein
VSSLQHSAPDASVREADTQDVVVDPAFYTSRGMFDEDWSPKDIAKAREMLFECGAPSVSVPAYMALDIRISASLFRLLSVMSLFAAGGLLVLSQRELAERIGVTQQQVSKQLAIAEIEGYVEKAVIGTKKTWRMKWLWQPDPQPTVEPDPHPTAKSASNTSPTVVTSQPGDVAHAPALSSPSTLSTSTPLGRVNSGRSSGPAPLTEDQRATIHQRYDRQLPGPVAVDEIIETALSHKNTSKWKTEYLYVLGWVRREADKYRLYLAQLATEQARLERAKAPYRPAVSAEPKPLKLTSIDAVDPLKPYDIAVIRWQNDHPDDRWRDPSDAEIQPYLAGVAS